MILIVKHIEIEGPGIVGDFFKKKKYRIETIDLSKGESLPKEIGALEAVIVLGGPMNVYEEEKYPFLKAEDVFIRKVLKNDVPFLGICLGAQLLAKACGAKVKKARHKEVGFYKVQLTETGAKDVFFSGITSPIDVFQWHEDTFDIPREGKVLATSRLCRNQAFRAGGNAYGLQFHLEITREMIGEWTSEYFDSGSKVLEEKGLKMLAYYDKVSRRLEDNIAKICKNFMTLVKR